MLHGLTDEIFAYGKFTIHTLLGVWNWRVESQDIFDCRIVDSVLIGGHLGCRSESGRWSESGHGGHGMGGRVEQVDWSRTLCSGVGILTPRLSGCQRLSGVLVVVDVGGGFRNRRTSGSLVHLLRRLSNAGMEKCD